MLWTRQSGPASILALCLASAGLACVADDRDNSAHNPIIQNPENKPSSASNDEESEESQSDAEDDSGSKGKKSAAEDNSDHGDDQNSGSIPNFDLGEVGDGPGPKTVPCSIDFLFVIDNSGSMADEQQNLARSVPEFIKTLTKEVDDLGSFNIGVTTTDNYLLNGKGCALIGSLVTQTFGTNSANRICGPYKSKRNYMTREDDLHKTFTCAAKPGTDGDANERPIDAMRAALDPKALGSGKCNEGFLRKDALLVVVMITDEEDDPEILNGGGSTGSFGEPLSWHQDILKLKGGDPRRVVMLGLIGTPKPNTCSVLVGPKENIQETGAQISLRLKSFIERFGKRGVVGDVCAPNYGPFFEKAISVIDYACEELPEG